MKIFTILSLFLFSLETIAQKTSIQLNPGYTNKAVLLGVKSYNSNSLSTLNNAEDYLNPTFYEIYKKKVLKMGKR